MTHASSPGAGNSAFPLLSANKNPDLRIHAYDYSSHAVKVVQNTPLYLEPPIGSIQASVWDLTSKQGIPTDLQPGTVDIVVLVFVLSALHPDEWVQAVDNIHTVSLFCREAGIGLFHQRHSCRC